MRNLPSYIGIHSVEALPACQRAGPLRIWQPKLEEGTLERQRKGYQIRSLADIALHFVSSTGKLAVIKSMCIVAVQLAIC